MSDDEGGIEAAARLNGLALTPRAMHALRCSCERDGATQTDTINRAIQVYEYLTSAVAAGSEVLLREVRTGTLERLQIR